MTATQSSTISLMVERVLFHPLSSRFLKENHFLGGSCAGTFGTFGPKGAFGSQKHVEEEIFQREGNLAISLATFCSLLFQICLLQPKRFKILPLDGGPQQLVRVNFVSFKLDQGFNNF